MPSQAEAHPDDGCMSLEQIGDIIGVSRGRVQQIEASALHKIRLGVGLERRIGKERAAPILQRLKGQTLRRWQETIRRVLEHQPARRIE